jgi:hypothetical protein
MTNDHQPDSPSSLDLSALDLSKLTPIPVILARSIQKFFSGKLTPTTQNSDLDVPTLLEDIDVILDGRSLEDGSILLRGMVADLLKEIDLLRFRLDETTKSLQRVKEERDIVNHDYRDRLLALTLALSSHDADTANHLQQKCRAGATVSPNEATMLTIQSLTKKIETLNLQVGKQQEQLLLRRERIDDLESDNAAKVHKIAALERQLLVPLSGTSSNAKATPSPPVSKVVAQVIAHSPTSVVAAPSSVSEEPSPMMPSSMLKKKKAVWQPPPTSFVPAKASSPLEKQQQQYPAPQHHGSGGVTKPALSPYNAPPPATKKYAKPKLVKLVDISS